MMCCDTADTPETAGAGVTTVKAVTTLSINKEEAGVVTATGYGSTVEQ
jgi:hypothetical protein